MLNQAWYILSERTECYFCAVTQAHPQRIRDSVSFSWWEICQASAKTVLANVMKMGSITIEVMARMSGKAFP